MYNYIAETIFKFIPKEQNINLIEIGCGTGYMKTLLPKNWKYTGTTVRQSELKQNKDLVYQDILDLKYDNNSFDVVVCNHTLEYVVDQTHGLCEILRIIKKYGYIFLNYGYDKNKPLNSTHKYLLTSDAFKEIFKCFGFDLIMIDSFDDFNVTNEFYIARKLEDTE